jgi:hypothetical protein
MLDTFMKIGAYRVERFEVEERMDPDAFAFYIRGEKAESGAYCRDAKSQLYAGLMLIQSKGMMHHLSGIYVDVDELVNLQRPAYRQLKADLIDGLFKHIFVLEAAAFWAPGIVEDDLRQLYLAVGGFELLVCREGECTPLQIF